MRPTAQELSRFAGLYVNQVTGNVTYVFVRDTALMVGRASGPTLIPIAERRFWFPAQRTEWTFAPNGDLVLTFLGQAIVEFTRDANGRVTGLLMTTGRVRKLRFAKTSCRRPPNGRPFVLPTCARDASRRKHAERHTWPTPSASGGRGDCSHTGTRRASAGPEASGVPDDW